MEHRGRFSIGDAVLLLLYAQPAHPVWGRYMVMQEVHLLSMMFPVDVPPFEATRNGVFSGVINDTLLSLESGELLTRNGRKGSRNENFKITRGGIRRIQLVFDGLPPETRLELQESRKGFDQLGHEGLGNYISRVRRGEGAASAQAP